MKLSLLFVNMGIGPVLSGVFQKSHWTDYKIIWTDTFSFEFFIN